MIKRKYLLISIAVVATLLGSFTYGLSQNTASASPEMQKGIQRDDGLSAVRARYYIKTFLEILMPTNQYSARPGCTVNKLGIKIHRISRSI